MPSVPVGDTGKLENWRTEKQYLDVLWIPAHTLPVLRRPKLATVVTIHGLEYQWLPEYKNLLQRWYLPLSTKYAASRATRLIAVSKFTKNQLVKQLYTNLKKIKVVHEGVDIRRSVSQHVSVSVGNGKYILFVGSLQPRKNLPALVEAFSLLEGKYSDYCLVIAGGRGWMTEEIYQAPARYGVEERVVFTGRVSDRELARLYQGASLYVQPSLTEGFGLPILEAMELGVPVVSSDGGALTEVVGEAGIVVPLAKARFPMRLATEIAKVLDDTKLRARMVRAGKKRVSELTWQVAAVKTLQVLLEAAN